MGWIEEEFAGVQLGDGRLNKRILELAKCFEKKHGHSVAYSCSDWKTAKSAYRFFDNEEFNESDIIAPHIKATEARVNRLGETVLVIHDTTEFNYAHHNATEGLGYLETKPISAEEQQILSNGFLMHASMALTRDGVPLGLINQKQWTRDSKNLECKKGIKSYKQKPIEDKESYKWIEGISRACANVDPAGLVHVCDREADIYELFDKCMELQTHFVVRAVQTRSTSRKGVKSFARLSRVPKRGTYTLPIKASQKRSARDAQIDVKFYKVKLVPPVGKTNRCQPVEVYVVSAKERKSEGVKETELIDWKLLTDLPIETFQQALEVITWYQMRWNIETYFKVLKSGFGTDKSRLRHGDRIRKFVALVSVLAWRVFWLTTITRSCPNESPTLCYGREEIKALQAIEKRQGRTLYLGTSSLKEVTVAVARLGGYLARRSDPPPGNIVIWRGLQRLHDITMLREGNNCG